MPTTIKMQIKNKGRKDIHILNDLLFFGSDYMTILVFLLNGFSFEDRPT